MSEPLKVTVGGGDESQRHQLGKFLLTYLVAEYCVHTPLAGSLGSNGSMDNQHIDLEVQSDATATPPPPPPINHFDAIVQRLRRLTYEQGEIVKELAGLQRGMEMIQSALRGQMRLNEGSERHYSIKGDMTSEHPEYDS